MIGYIYCITNIVNGRQYVGKTTTSINQRFREHLRDRHKHEAENRPLYRAIDKYGEENFLIEVLEEVQNNNLSEREEFWINKLDTYHNGYNATLGGDGRQMFDYDEISILIKQRKTTSEIIEIIGCKEDTVYKVARLNNLTIFYPKNETTKEMEKSRVFVQQYDLNNNFIQSFNSYTDAAKWIYENGHCKTLNGGVRSHIGDAAKGKRKTAYGFIWKNG